MFKRGLEKRGISAVITTLIIILLVIVAAGILWVVLRGFITEGTESINIGQFTLSMSITGIDIEGDEIKVKVQRNSGQGEFNAIKFFFSDGENTVSVDRDVSLTIHEEKTFKILMSELEDVSFIKKVSIAPVLLRASGKESVGSISDEEEYSYQEIMKNLGAISWWRFEDNAKDELEVNSGSINGAQFSEGKFGKAAQFDGVDDYIEVMDSDSLNIVGDEITIMVWANQFGFGGDIDKVLISKDDETHPSSGGYSLIYGWGPDLRFRAHIEGIHKGVLSSIAPVRNQWYHTAGTYDGSTMKIFVDGENVGEKVVSGQIGTTAESLKIGGSPVGQKYPFEGLLDEAIIFNRVLSEEEIRNIYNLDIDNFVS